MALGYIIIRHLNTPHSVYLRGTVHPKPDNRNPKLPSDARQAYTVCSGPAGAEPFAGVRAEG